MNHPPTLTGPQTAALRVLADRTDPAGTGPRTVHARAVAKALWPDSPAWTRVTHRYGAGGGGAGTPGGTMPMKAGTLLGRLADAGVAEGTGEWGRAWRITPLGVDVLAGTATPRARPRPARDDHVVRPPKPGRVRSGS